MPRITHVEAIPVHIQGDVSQSGQEPLPGSHYYRTPHRGLIYSPNKERLFVKITADDGHVGWGEGGSTGAAVLHRIVQDYLTPQLLGQDPLAVEFLWAEMRRSMWDRGGATGFFADGMAGIDLALWDLKGRILGQPVYALAGGPFMARIPTYQSGIPGRTPEERAASAQEYVAQGVKAIKLHLTAGRADTIATAEAVRAAVGEEVLLGVDAHNIYDVAEAIQVGRALEALGYHFFEAPTNPEDLAGLAEIARALQIRVAIGEGERTLNEYRDRIVGRAADILQPDINFTGFSLLRHVALLADAFHVGLMPHLSNTLGYGIAASMHLMASIPNGLLLEHRLQAHEMMAPLFGQPLMWEAGDLLLPEGPGFGIEPDEEALRAHALGA